MQRYNQKPPGDDLLTRVGIVLAIVVVISFAGLLLAALAAGVVWLWGQV